MVHLGCHAEHSTAHKSSSETNKSIQDVLGILPTLENVRADPYSEFSPFKERAVTGQKESVSLWQMVTVTQSHLCKISGAK